MNVLQIVGYSNSGKTTLTCRLIQSLNDKGIRVGVVKHHGHIHKADEDLLALDKDTGKQWQGGAQSVMLATSAGFKFATRNEPSLQDYVAWHEQQNQIDLLLVEGFKDAAYPKVLMLRTEKDAELIDQITNVIAVVIYKNKDRLPGLTSIPVFYSDDRELMELLHKQVRVI